MFQVLELAPKPQTAYEPGTPSYCVKASFQTTSGKERQLHDHICNVVFSFGKHLIEEISKF